MKTQCGRLLRQWFPIVGFAWAASSVAQSVAPGQLPPVFVTATRSPVPLRDVLADVTVIDRSELERRVGSLGDVLRGVPGFEMARSGGPAGTTSMYVRGADQRFTAVMVDGVRVDSQSTGGATWEAIPLSQIDRVEIVRGPASAVYGSDAIGGVVQVFTRRGEPGLRFDAGLVGGSFNTAKGDVGVSGATGPWSFALAGHDERTDGFNARTPGNPDRDGHRSQGGSGRVALTVGGGHVLEAAFLRSHVNGQYDSSATDDDRSIHDLDTRRIAWKAPWTTAWTSSVSLNESKDHYATSPSVYETDTRVRTALVQNDWRLGGHEVHVSLERREDRLENGSLVGSPLRERDLDSVALGYGWRAGVFALQANVRHDTETDFGSTTTGTLATGVDIAPGWRVQTSVGNGFRAPTLYQRFSDAGPAGPAPALQPERSRRNVEVSVLHTAGRFSSRVTAYDNRITNLIAYGNPDAAYCPSTWGCYRNVARATLKGLTLAGNYADDGGLRVSGTVDIQSPKNADTGRVLARRARQHGALTVEQAFGEAQVTVQWIGSGKRLDRDTTSTVLRGYSVVNVELQQRIHPEWTVHARIDNLFDRVYQTAATYHTDRQAAWFGVRWTPSL